MGTETLKYSPVTLQEARDRVLGIINEDSGGQFNYARIDGHLFDMGRRITAMVRKAPEEAWVSTVASTPDYLVPGIAAPNGTPKVISVAYAGTDLTEQPYDADTTLTGTPEAFAVFNGEVWLYPTPDDTGELRVEYVPQFIPPAESSDSFPLDDEQVTCCILYAAYMMKLMDEEYTAAGMLKAQYEDAYAALNRVQTGVYKFGQKHPVGMRGTNTAYPS